MTSKNKPKTTSTKKTISNSIATEIKRKIIINNNDSSTTSSSTSIMLFRLHSRTMKVNHIECKEKAICKAQRNLKKTQINGNEEEIAKVQEILDNAISDKKMRLIGCIPAPQLKNHLKYSINK